MPARALPRCFPTRGVCCCSDCCERLTPSCLLFLPSPPPPRPPSLLLIDNSSLSHHQACFSGGPGVSPEASSQFMIMMLEIVQQLQGWRAVDFQNLALALAPRTFVFKNQTGSGMESGTFSKLGSRLGAATLGVKVCNRYRDGGGSHFTMRLWGACFSRARSPVGKGYLY